MGTLGARRFGGLWQVSMCEKMTQTTPVIELGACLRRGLVVDALRMMNSVTQAQRHVQYSRTQRMNCQVFVQTAASHEDKAFVGIIRAHLVLSAVHPFCSWIAETLCDPIGTCDLRGRQPMSFGLDGCGSALDSFAESRRFGRCHFHVGSRVGSKTFGINHTGDAIRHRDCFAALRCDVSRRSRRPRLCRTCFHSSDERRRAAEKRCRSTSRAAGMLGCCQPGWAAKSVGAAMCLFVFPASSWATQQCNDGSAGWIEPRISKQRQHRHAPGAAGISTGKQHHWHAASLRISRQATTTAAA